MEIPKELYQFLMLIGFPAAFLGFSRFLLSRIKRLDTESKAVQAGVQALLRDRLYAMHSKYYEQGYAPLYAKENFANMYKQYHSLGENGVMDKLKEDFEDLPTIPNKDKEKASC